MDIQFREEQPSDFREVEELIREAFWNLYVQGCDEHYFLHKLRKSDGFLPELDFVAILDDKIVAHIAYFETQIIDHKGSALKSITFGPVSVLPQFQGNSIGSKLIRHTIDLANQIGYKVIVIFGYPEYYSRFGFEASKKFGITAEQGKFPYAMQILELQKGALEGISGEFQMLLDYAPTPEAVEEFDKSFPSKEKFYTESQKRFSDASKRYL